MANQRNQTAVSDEEIVAALLSSGSIQQAASNLGIGARTMYDRMGTREFRAVYSAAKSDLVREAILTMNRNLSEAVAVVSSIMTDRDTSPATRLQAAKLIIDNAAKFTDRLTEADSTTANLAGKAFSFDFD